MAKAHAPGKIILFGEHAVVYGHPAIAVPVTQVQAQATVEEGERGQGIVIVARDVARTVRVGQGQTDEVAQPLQTIVTRTLQYLELGLGHDLTVTIESTIPIARGLGSGAAVSTAITKALAGHFSKALAAEEVSGLVYQVEKLYHGTPSGIDNTVIAYERPVYFVRDQKPETFHVGESLLFVIADTGLESPTREVVAAVRQAWKRSRETYDTLFLEVGRAAALARRAIEEGEVEQVGRLMDENQRLLQAMDVSSPQLDGLVEVARRGGALGAKLSGAGRGGNIIALVAPQKFESMRGALERAGAQGIIHTELEASADVAGSPVPGSAIT